MGRDYGTVKTQLHIACQRGLLKCVRSKGWLPRCCELGSNLSILNTTKSCRYIAAQEKTRADLHRKRQQVKQRMREV